MKRIPLNRMNFLQTKAFKKELLESSGCVRIFIHPSSPTLSNTGFNRNHRFNKKDDTIKPLCFLEKVITVKPLKRTPIIVFEDYGNMYDFNRFLKDITLKRNIYMVDTINEDPEPKDGWQKCTELFQKLGIEKMVICGMYLYEYGGSNINQKNCPAISARGCVHGAALELSKQFQIKISHFVNPGPSSVYAQYAGKFSPHDHVTIEA